MPYHLAPTAAVSGKGLVSFRAKSTKCGKLLSGTFSATSLWLETSNSPALNIFGIQSLFVHENHILIYIKTQNPLFSAQQDRVCQIKVSMTRRFFRTSQKVPPEPSATPGRNWDSRLITNSKYPPRKPAKPGNLKTQVLE